MKVKKVFGRSRFVTLFMIWRRVAASVKVKGRVSKSRWFQTLSNVELV